MDIEVSIIVPIYNKGEYIRACLESILGQSLASIEVICIDDGSTDSSRKELEAFAERDSRVVVLENSENIGAAASRNRGILYAQGRFLRFVDADDLLPAMSTEALLRRAICSGSDVVRGALAIFHHDNRSSYHEIIGVEDCASSNFAAEPSLWIPYWHTSYLISTQLVRSHNILYPKLRRGEDPAFLASVLTKAQRISLTSEVVYLYRKYPKSDGSAATSFHAVADTLAHAAMVKRLFKIAHAPSWDHGYGPFLLDDFREFLSRCHLSRDQAALVLAEAKMLWGDYVELFFQRSPASDITKRSEVE